MYGQPTPKKSCQKIYFLEQKISNIAGRALNRIQYAARSHFCHIQRERTKNTINPSVLINCNRLNFLFILCLVLSCGKKMKRTFISVFLLLKGSGNTVINWYAFKILWPDLNINSKN